MKTKKIISSITLIVYIIGVWYCAYKFQETTTIKEMIIWSTSIILLFIHIVGLYIVEKLE